MMHLFFRLKNVFIFALITTIRVVGDAAAPLRHRWLGKIRGLTNGKLQIFIAQLGVKLL
jgi:hypothetical protein